MKNLRNSILRRPSILYKPTIMKTETTPPVLSAWKWAALWLAAMAAVTVRHSLRDSRPHQLSRTPPEMVTWEGSRRCWTAIRIWSSAKTKKASRLCTRRRSPGVRRWHNFSWPTRRRSKRRTSAARRRCSWRSSRATTTWQNCYWPTGLMSIPPTTKDIRPLQWPVVEEH